MTVTHMSRRDRAVSHAHVTVPPTRPDPTRPSLKSPPHPSSLCKADPASMDGAHAESIR